MGNAEYMGSEVWPRLGRGPRPMRIGFGAGSASLSRGHAGCSAVGAKTIVFLMLSPFHQAVPGSWLQSRADSSRRGKADEETPQAESRFCMRAASKSQARKCLWQIHLRSEFTRFAKSPGHVPQQSPAKGWRWDCNGIFFVYFTCTIGLVRPAGWVGAVFLE